MRVVFNAQKKKKKETDNILKFLMQNHVPQKKTKTPN